jgi:hypothetical protein
MQGQMAFYNNDGTINEEATKLIKLPSGATSKWFRNFMSYTLDSIFWGYELIAINVKDNKIYVKKMPERNLIPSRNVLLKDTRGGLVEGNVIDYTKGKYDLVMCKVSYTGDKNDLGLLSGCAPYFFSKATNSWKMHADKFGMLTRVLKTNTENKDKMASGYQAMKNQMRANFVTIGPDDELTFEGDTRSNITIYKDLNKYCDENISKVLLGQTSTTDEKSFSGSSEVHQNVLENIITSDREFVETVVNDQLIPKLQMLGMLPAGVYFGISEKVNVDLKELSTIVKELSQAGYKPTVEYIEETFGMPIETVVDPNANTENNED